MKKNSRNTITKLVLFCLLQIGATAIAQDQVGMKQDPNRTFAFKKLYIEPVQDNVDGAFKQTIESSFRDVFDKNPRFEITTDPKEADAILRSRVEKKASGTQLDISLSLGSTGETFTDEKTIIPIEASPLAIRLKAKELLKTSLRRIPFYGTITGREANELTFDIGEAHGLKKGDVVQVSRIDQVKKHPLLKSIVDVQVVPVGNAIIDEVEETISFGHVKNEIAGERIGRFYKVTAIEMRPAEAFPKRNLDKKKANEEAENEEDPRKKNLVEPMEDEDSNPHTGYVDLGLFLGQFTNVTSINLGAAKSDASSFILKGQLKGEVWFSKNFFADLTLGYSSFSLTPRITGSSTAAETAATTAETALDAKIMHYGGNIGYRYFFEGWNGPSAYGKAGYYHFNLDTPLSVEGMSGGKTYSGLNIGAGGTLPFANGEYGALLDVGILFFPSFEETGFKTSSSPEYSSTVVSLYFGGYWVFNKSFTPKLGFFFENATASFDKNNSSTTQRQMGILPSISYYF